MLESRRMLSIVAASASGGEIHGSVWDDLNSDGLWSAEEPGIAGWRVYLDYNNDEAWHWGEPIAITDIYGNYAFTDLAADTYYVREFAEDDWGQTFPDPTEVASSEAFIDPTSSVYQTSFVSESETVEAIVPDDIVMRLMDSGSTQPTDYIDVSMVQTASSTTPVMLDEVPTSTWTYGCSATAAGMIFGYYDRHDYPDMYTGETNGGVAPLTDLGQGSNVASPITGSCSIIATQNGFDGRTTDGHVDDYWISNGSEGPDPFEIDGREEHAWGDCLADYMGTNQWKWDFDYISGLDRNADGSTTLYYSSSGLKTYDYIPASRVGSPQTALSHGMRLFAESRGYSIVENYSQAIDSYSTTGNGFTFVDYTKEIDAGRPVMIQLSGHSMVGVGYDESTETVYLHDTWSNIVQTMAWGGSYSGMAMEAITVIKLAPPMSGVPYDHVIELGSGQVITNVNFSNQVISDIPEVQVYFVDGLASVHDDDSSPSVSKGTDFETSGLGKAGVARTFRVYNSGNVTLTTTELTAPVGMTITESLDAEIAPRSYDDFTVQIDTTSLGQMTGSITFLNNDDNEGAYDFLVTGEVVDSGSPQLYVDGSVPTGGDGQSWATAFSSIQEAMDEAVELNQDESPHNDVHEIWIAQGTYTPTLDRQGNDVLGDADTSNDRTATLSLLNGIALIGGFIGDETTPNERVMDSDGTWRHETVVSGDIGVLGDSSDNAYTVIYSGLDVAARIDGLTVINGSTEATTSTDNEHKHGAGIYLDAGELVVENCLVTGNSATDGGGDLQPGLSYSDQLDCRQ